MKSLQAATLTLFLLSFIGPALAGPDVPSKFTNRDSIANTRHNLTQQITGLNSSLMDTQRNQYEQVCVYCHTPHGANDTLDAPLWNRTHLNTTYTTYDTLGTSTLTQAVSQPGVNSLTCLSCHDGTVGIDSIINMPNANSAGTASGNYSAAQMTSQNNGFLDTWVNVSGSSAGHVTLGNSNEDGSNVGCMACHSNSGSGAFFPQATDFRIFVIGTDLTNDHPVGITYPAARTVGADADFNATNGSLAGKMTWYDDDSDGRAQKDEIRFYDTGDGPEVECASCHDPHGVPSGGAGSQFNATFLRTSNSGSAVCQTCHNK